MGPPVHEQGAWVAKLHNAVMAFDFVPASSVGTRVGIEVDYGRRPRSRDVQMRS